MRRTTIYNKYQVPRIEKIVINRGLGDASQNAKILQSSLDELLLPVNGVLTRSKKAIAAKREKTPVGICYITWKTNVCFLDRLIHLALPRIRDFQGISQKF
jgi:large subunit ribosomal protein L5